MGKHGKKFRKVQEGLDPKAVLELDEAVKLLKSSAHVKFDETAELAFRLGVDPKKSEQMVRGTVALPHGTGKKVRVIVFANGPAAEAAVKAGADLVGFEDLIAKVQGGWTDFDVAIATPDAMKEVRKLGKVLGPRGLMPNPKTGTVMEDTALAVAQCRAGRVEFKMDRNGNVMAPFGKLSFAPEQLVENAMAIITAVQAAKPSSAKGIYIKRCTVTSTMGPGLHIRLRDQAAT